MLFRRLVTRLENSVDESTIDLDKNFDERQRAERLMVFYSELGEYEAQKDVLAKLIKGGDIPDRLLFSAALCFQLVKEYTKAIELYTRLLVKQPDYTAALNNRGNCFAAIGYKDLAFTDYERAVTLNGDAVERVNFASMLRDRGRMEDACEQVRIAVRFHLITQRDTKDLPITLSLRSRKLHLNTLSKRSSMLGAMRLPAHTFQKRWFSRRSSIVTEKPYCP